MSDSHVRPNPPHTAEDWVVRLQSPDRDARTHVEFEDWLAASPAHAVAYARAERMHALAGALAGDPALRADAARAYRTLRARPPAWRRPWALATAAVLVLAGVLGYRMLLLPADAGSLQVQTAMGESRSTTLADGSRITLDTDSAVEVRLMADRRLLRLQRGRIHIAAARDPARPMYVRAGDGEVRVTGTTFQVQRRDDAVEVALIEGAVEVRTGMADTAAGAKRSLAAGEQVRYFPDGRIGPVRPLALEQARGWLDGRLVFQDSPLAVVVADANRYATVQLVLADPALAALRVSGQVRAGDQDSLAAALATGWGLHVERRDDATIVLSRR